MKCGICDTECGNEPKSYLFETTTLKPLNVKNLDGTGILFCNRCTVDLFDYVKRVIQQFGDGICITCGIDCIGVQTYCLMFLDTFEPLTVKEVRIIGSTATFCKRCSEPLSNYIRILRRTSSGMSYH